MHRQFVVLASTKKELCVLARYFVIWSRGGGKEGGREGEVRGMGGHTL